MSTGSSTLSGNRSVALTTVIGFDVPFNTRDVKWKAELTGDLKSPFHYVIEEPTEPGVVEHVPGCNQSGCFGECMGLRRDLQVLYWALSIENHCSNCLSYLMFFSRL